MNERMRHGIESIEKIRDDQQERIMILEGNVSKDNEAVEALREKMKTVETLLTSTRRDSELKCELLASS
jgi:cell division FtsZ-interacting protein ZapD